MANDELFTPRHIFEALGLEFDLDPCSPISGSLVPAKKVYSLPFDGLSAAWFGMVWMNPPYSKPAPWVDRWLDHKNGLALLPLSGNAKWWRQIWESDAKVVNLQPHTYFITPDGKKQKIMFGVSLWAIGNVATEALRHSGLGRIR